MTPWLLSMLGLVILLLAGDALVRGAVNLSLRLGVPALIVSLTIVAFGTSAPELLIAISAIQDNAPGIALGNVVGSNTANILLVLGIPAILTTLHTSECDSRKTYIFMIAASVVFIGLAFCGTFTLGTGLILLALLGLVLFDMMRDARAHRRCGGPDQLEDIPSLLPKDYSQMNYTQIRYIRMDDNPLPHWEELIGFFATMDGELLRFMLHAKIPLEKLIRYELAIRGFDKNHIWCGFEKAENIWLK